MVDAPIETAFGVRLEFEHRGWEQLGDLGVEKRKAHEGGWDVVLGKYTEAARAYGRR